MHEIEPFFNWRHLYTAEEDENSPFFGAQYDEFAYSKTIYNYLIHPQWDDFGSDNLYLKILYADYQFSFAIIEMIGEWNDCIGNDIMILKREVIDPLISKGIYKFILITENVLNFHSSDDCYYEEWQEDIMDKGGWIAALNMPEQTEQEFRIACLDRYVNILTNDRWRTFQPAHLYHLIDDHMLKMIETS
jgi:hypothetical protein